MTNPNPSGGGGTPPPPIIPPPIIPTPQPPSPQPPVARRDYKFISFLKGAGGKRLMLFVGWLAIACVVGRFAYPYFSESSKLELSKGLWTLIGILSFFLFLIIVGGSIWAIVAYMRQRKKKVESESARATPAARVVKQRIPFVNSALKWLVVLFLLWMVSAPIISAYLFLSGYKPKEVRFDEPEQLYRREIIAPSGRRSSRFQIPRGFHAEGFPKGDVWIFKNGADSPVAKITPENSRSIFIGNDSRYIEYMSAGSQPISVEIVMYKK